MSAAAQIAGAALRGVVKAAYVAAVKNGYSFEGWTREQIAIDMLDCDADIETSGADVEMVVAALADLNIGKPE